jgi:predicted amidohydrolase YtcJ
MRELKIYASMQPTHYFGDQSIVQTLGEQRFRHMHRIGTLQRAKVNLAFGTDFSIVPMNPIYGLIAATTRLNCLGWPVTEAEKKEIIRIDDAIRHYTIGSARALKMDDRIGSLEVGKRADFVLFSLDSVWPILETGFGNVDIELLDSLVLATFVDGRIVYQRK